jgi:uncharacterized protein YecT (DUF1311 family)
MKIEVSSLLRRPLRAAVVALVVAAMHPPSCAAQHMNAPDAPCRKPMDGADETRCFYEASVSRDKELNKAYQASLKVLEPNGAALLRAAQRSWLQFRGATCRAEKELYNGGSAQGMVFYACLEAQTRYRIKDLNDTYGWRIEKFR